MNIDLIKRSFPLVSDKCLNSIDGGEDDVWFFSYFGDRAKYRTVEEFLSDVIKLRIAIESGVEKELVSNNLFNDYLSDLERFECVSVSNAQNIIRKWFSFTKTQFPKELQSLVGKSNSCEYFCDCEGTDYEFLLLSKTDYLYLVLVT